MATTAGAWSAEWIDLTSASAKNSPSTITPARSGHVAFALQDKVYLFGGYAEEPPQPTAEGGDAQSMPVRYPTNDLWRWDNSATDASGAIGWKCLQESDLWGNQGEVDPSSKLQPQQRLAAAAAATSQTGFVFGGWDSQEFGTGGVILEDVAAYDPVTSKWESSRSNSGAVPSLVSPTSRLIATTLDDEKTILLHNHRCEESVILFETTPNGDAEIFEQPTTGEAPCPRGLHAAATVGQWVVIFGGATQSGEMSNEVFVLDTKSWRWTKAAVVSKEKPSKRASPCLVSLAHTSTSCSCILFGGADRSLDEQGVALHGCNDSWVLELNTAYPDKLSASWTRLETPLSPPGRNAATLTRLSAPPAWLSTALKDSDSLYFLLAGGWYPFQKTHSDCFVMKVSKTK